MRSDFSLVAASTVNVRSTATAPNTGVDLSTDLGLVPLFSIGDRVFLDVNADGIQVSVSVVAVSIRFDDAT